MLREGSPALGIRALGAVPLGGGVPGPTGMLREAGLDGAESAALAHSWRTAGPCLLPAVRGFGTGTEETAQGRDFSGVRQRVLGFQRDDKVGGGEGKEAVSTLLLELLCVGT